MSNSSSFTISSVGASLAEVIGDGPYSFLSGGVYVPNGTPTTAPVDLLNGWERRWRVIAPVTKQATVSITESPYGAFLQLRRCVPLPLLHGSLRHLLSVRLPCAWEDVGANNNNQLTAHGGDVVVVVFAD
jgi:hypothetical protein